MANDLSAQDVATDLEVARFQRLNRRMVWAVSAVLAAIAAVMALTLWVVARLPGDHPKLLLRVALSWSPTLFYLWALWSLRGLFKSLAGAGPRFQPGAIGALSRVGWGVTLGAVVALAITPVLASLEAGHASGWFAKSNAPALTLAMVGLALVVLARVLRRAARIEARVKTLEETLEGFI